MAEPTPHVKVKIGQVWSNPDSTTARHKSVDIAMYNGKLYAWTRIIRSDGTLEDKGPFGPLTDDECPKRWDDGWAPEETATVVAVHEADGCSCRVCHNFFHMAVPNRPSGHMICWSCRQGWLPKGW